MNRSRFLVVLIVLIALALGSYFSYRHYYPRFLVSQLDDPEFMMSELGNSLAPVGSKAVWWRPNQITNQLVDLGDMAVPALLEALHSEVPVVRRRAITALERIKNPDLPPLFLKAADETELSGYDPHAPKEEREKAIRKWEEWWAGR